MGSGTAGTYGFWKPGRNGLAKILVFLLQDDEEPLHSISLIALSNDTKYHNSRLDISIISLLHDSRQTRQSVAELFGHDLLALDSLFRRDAFLPGDEVERVWRC